METPQEKLSDEEQVRQSSPEEFAKAYAHLEKSLVTAKDILDLAQNNGKDEMAQTARELIADLEGLKGIYDKVKSESKEE